MRMTKQNLHDGMIKGGKGLKGTQYYDNYEQNENYHLGDHGNEEEVLR